MILLRIFQLKGKYIKSKDEILSESKVFPPPTSLCGTNLVSFFDIYVP